MISVVIPCFNCEKFVMRAINSVEKQVFTDWEIIAVNNNSTDNTRAVLEQVEKQWPHRFKLLDELKKGAPAARNTGLKHARGEWIQFLDADDELLPSKFQDQIDIIRNQDVDVIVSEAIVFKWVHGKTLESTRKVYKSDFWSGLILSLLGITSTNLWRKDMLEDIGGWNEAMSSSQEYDLLFRMMKKGAKVVFDNKTNTIIHQADSVISKSFDKEKVSRIVDNRIQLRLDIKQYLTETGQLNVERKRLIDNYIYCELMFNKDSIPTYVKSRMNSLVLDVDIKDRMKQNFEYAKRMVKRVVIRR
ncbi:glycosyltransferase family 2 protein [Olivibacter domesticus]|uniref:Glycosyl transferase family 2 n=1 Tax=Olivibacter domesticus TaxID=407022 RepID=A0A1H7UPI8_OLID1|nr:glycosyltransferase family A protein [Olivibacter domesticus]SEL98706.1 Glycosyl transferase family 2 [Olivibacter domesticus]